MSVKVTGIILVLLCGVYITYEVKKSFDKRIENLSSFYSDCEYFINSISFMKTPVCEMILTVSKNKSRCIKEFYENVLCFLKTGNTDLLAKEIDNSSLYFNKKDKEIIYDFFANLGKCDFEEQINTLKVKSSVLKNIIDEARENKAKNEKAKCTLTMCCFLLVVILFI